MTTATLHNDAPGATARAHIDAFGPLAETLPGAGGALARLRADALARFAEHGLPTRRLEDWKFTGLDALARSAFAPARAGTDAPVARTFLDRLAPVTDALRLVFVNGAFRADLSSDLAGVAGIAPLSAAAANDAGIPPDLAAGNGAAQALVALNAAFMTDGAVIALADGTALARPVVLVHLSGGDGAAVHTRNVVTLGAAAEARVVELFATLPGVSPAFTNTVTDVHLARGARLHHARIAAEGDGALHHAHAAVAIGAGADYRSVALSVGGSLTRQETDAVFAGPGGHAQLLGAYLARGRQHMDHTTRVRHAHPGCATEELFKGVVDDHAHGVFQGLIHVAPHAVGTDAHQQNRNLLLSDRAVADTKPELEILADDVKCTHGATVGDLDADEMFYLRARGIAPDDARRLLIAGYVSDLLERIEDAAVRAAVRTHADAWIGTEEE